MPLFRAICVENVDPESRGRIRFRAKQPKNAPIDTLPYAEYCSPFGGGDNVNGAGFFFAPEVGSQVWILEEEDDPTSPVWIGSSFYNIGGRQNIPIEAVPTTIEPSIRIIKSIAGHKLIFDDRPQKPNGDPVDSVLLVNGSGTGLTLNEPGGSGRGIRLGFGQHAAELIFTREGARLQSNKRNGLFINDTYDMVKIADSTNSAFLQTTQKKINIQAESGITILTPSATIIDSAKGFKIKSAGGIFEVKAANQKFVSGSDFVVQTGGNFNVNSTQFNLTGQFGSNYSLDLPIPGIPGLNQGNISLTTTAGGILLRNGLPVPLLPFITPVTFIQNDLLMPTMAGRLGIGDSVSGNALLEGRLGGIFISGVPIPLPGSALGLGGRLPIPGTPIIPTGFPGSPQPMVLGGNLFQMLTQFFIQLNAFLGILTANTPAFVATPVGPGILSPGVIAGIATLQAGLNTIQQTFFSPAPGLPTAILSSTVFTDG